MNGGCCLAAALLMASGWFSLGSLGSEGLGEGAGRRSKFEDGELTGMSFGERESILSTPESEQSNLQ